MTERARVVEEARAWLGTPYQDRQCVRGAGVDCLMLLWGVFGAIYGDLAAIPKPEYRPDEHLHRSGERYAEGIAQYFTLLPPRCCTGGPALPEPGDVLAFAYGRRQFAHAGIALDTEWFIAAERKHGRVEEFRLSDSGIRERWTGTWRLTRWATAT